MIAEVNGLRVRRAGTRGPAVVFAVDPPNALEHYDALFTALSSDCRLCAFELPGFGGSRRAAGGFGFAAMCAATAALLDELSAGPYVLVFPCVTGLIANALARSRPELVRAVAYVQTATWPETRRWAMRIDSRGLLRTPLVGQLLMRLRSGAVAHGWYRAALGDAERRARFDDIAQRRLRDGARYPLASMFQTWFREPQVEAAPPKAPALILWGLDDRTHRRTDRAASVSLASGAAVEELPGIGHFAELEDPAGFRRRLLALSG